MEKGGEDGGPSQPSAPVEDEYGIERVGFEWREVPHLFPFTEGMLKIDPRYLRPGALALGRMLGVTDLHGIERAIKTLGLEATLISMLITGQHHADGTLRQRPEVYFHGLVKRGRKGDLNLGHTIFGRREISNLHGSAQKSLPADERRQRSPHMVVSRLGRQS